jgi:hypothetical protein
VRHDFGAEQLRPYSGLVEDRAVGGARGDHRHETAALGHGARHPHEARVHVLLRVRRQLAHGAPHLGIRTGDEDAAGAGVEQRARDRRHLLGRLPLCEHGFRRALPELPVQVGPREPEVEERQLLQPLERTLRLDLAAPHPFEEVLQILAQARHPPDTLRARWSP